MSHDEPLFTNNKHSHKRRACSTKNRFVRRSNSIFFSSHCIRFVCCSSFVFICNDYARNVFDNTGWGFGMSHRDERSVSAQPISTGEMTSIRSHGIHFNCKIREFVVCRLRQAVRGTSCVLFQSLTLSTPNGEIGINLKIWNDSSSPVFDTQRIQWVWLIGGRVRWIHFIIYHDSRKGTQYRGSERLYNTQSHLLKTIIRYRFSGDAEFIRSSLNSHTEREMERSIITIHLHRNCWSLVGWVYSHRRTFFINYNRNLRY